MKIRNGIYTNYNGQELQIQEQRVEVPIETGEIPISLIDSTGTLVAAIKLKELTNAFTVTSFGEFDSCEVQVFDGRNENEFRVGSANFEVATRCGLIQVNDNWFIQDIEKTRLNHLWEERRPSKYSVPFPSAVLFKKIIF